MTHILAIALGTLAVLWAIQAVRVFVGMSRLPLLAGAPPLADAECPRISVLFAARDESEKLPQALPTLLAQDYPNYEVIAVDDRSTDATGTMLDDFAARDPRLNVLHLREIPPGWLGKPHALQRAYERASGEWLVFTDADVRFAPDVLRRAMSLARRDGFDHLSLLVSLDLRGFWEKAMVTFWMMGFTFSFEPWRVSNPRSSRYVGVGAFQLVRRHTYERAGTHRRLALEVVDDMKLGKIVKAAGFRSGVGRSEERIRVRWHDGAGNIIRGLEKNAFAANEFSLRRVFAGLIAMVLFDLLPFIAVVFAHGPVRWTAAACVAMAVLSQGAMAVGARVSPLYGFTHPIGALLMAWTVARSAYVTLRRGGVLWRGTFYPLSELRKGMV